VEALAAVTAAEPSNHNNVSYRYVVEGVTYKDTSLGRGREGGAADLTVGQRIHIVYDRTNPEAACYCVVATLRKPSDWWRTLIAGLFLPSVLVGFDCRPRSTGKARGRPMTADLARREPLWCQGAHSGQ
jgi:hypothetical protein